MHGPLKAEPIKKADKNQGQKAKASTRVKEKTEAALQYPETKRGDQVDDYHGTKVADPYRWLEDPDSEETKAWVKAENEVTFGWLAQIPQREPIRERITRLWNYERFGLPVQRAGRYFYSRNDGLQNQAVLYWAASLDAEPKLLLDPNQFSKDGTVALSGSALSDDGRLLAYGLATAGSDWQQWRIRDVESAQDLDDQIDWVKFSSASWTADSKGFFYSRFDEPAEGAELTGANYYQKLYFHQVGSKQAEDRLIYERPDEKEWGFGGEVTEDGRYLVVSVSRGTEEKHQLFYFDLEQPAGKAVELITGFDAAYTFVGNHGATLYLHTDLDAPRYRVIAIDLAHPEREHWREIIPQTESTLSSVGLVGEQLFASYLKDARSEVQVHDLAGKSLGEVALPGLGTAAGFGGRKEDTETFYSFTSFTVPATIYRYDIASGKSTIFRQPKVDFQAEDYETKQVFYESTDGTRVPMFITHKRGLKLDGRNPTLLYGYGGFNIPLTPAFNPGRLVWLEMGGVYAVPNLRGGGEYGREWHESGMKDLKQHVFDDFIRAAEWLIEKKYTSTDRLAINGGSNGGLLVGACMTQRPDLFGAAIPAVGVLDMLRYHKFTIGWAWVDEYGSADDAHEFATLLKYSPLHNVKSGTAYPATLILTGDHDDRVVPAHSFKFGATLQAAQSGQAPALIRIETSAGHGAGKPTSKTIEELADAYSFLVRVLKIDWSP